jgi:hypothetical protein
LLEEDWDPEQFEQKMKQAFDDEFYAQQDPEWREEDDVDGDRGYNDAHWWLADNEGEWNADEHGMH